MGLGVGSRVRLNPESRFKGQDEHLGRKHPGTIVSKTGEGWRNFDWKVKWDFESEAKAYYCNRDLIEIKSTNAEYYNNLREVEDEPCETLTDLLKIRSKSSSS